jgi:uncharacterized membrane protein
VLGISIVELIVALILLIFIGMAIVVVLRALGDGAQRSGQDREARQVLDGRYARGEIRREEYDQIHRDIESG